MTAVFATDNAVAAVARLAQQANDFFTRSQVFEPPAPLEATGESRGTKRPVRRT